MRRLFAYLACSSFVAFACGGATTTSLGSSGNGNDPNNSGSDSGAGAPGNPGNSGGPIQSGADASAGGCTDTSCPTGYWCKPGPGLCGGGYSITGTCEPKPSAETDCTALVPTCGCDGNEYCDANDANSHGVAMTMSTQCGFQCGSLTCNGGVQFCAIQQGGPPLPDGGTPEGTTCRNFAEVGCSADHSCACLQASGAKGSGCTEPGGDVSVFQDIP